MALIGALDSVFQIVQREQPESPTAGDETHTEPGAESAESRQFFYGGQAVIEGVMMRGQYVAAVSVRHPSGAIVAKEVPLNAALYRGRIARMPFVRGLVMLWDALGLGTRALMWSADVQLEEEEDIDFSLEGAAGTALIVVSLAMGIGLFFVLPAAASAVVKELTGLHSKLAADVIEGVIKLLMLTGYMWLIGHMEDVKRLFGYHGAEHKTINAYEDGAELTPEITDTYPIEHPRCGTAFLLTLVVLSVVIHIVTGRPDSVIVLLLSRLGLIFPIAGIAYEVIRFTAKHLDNPLIRLMIKPNLWLQGLTTRPPDHGMLEVGIWSLKKVLAAEKAGVALTETRVTEVQPSPSGD
ncbi:MAG: DUF1385 domain-containing protein [Anaerolineae bacterium]|nr:DUF1385 domain-containing protein [Anaerolineae bacterium]